MPRSSQDNISWSMVDGPPHDGFLSPICAGAVTSAHTIYSEDTRDLVRAWLAEDIGRGDITTASVVMDVDVGRARIETRQPCTVAGVEVAASCFDIVSGGELEFETIVRDGERAASGDVIASVEGPLSPILTAERTALNILARMSGVATTTNRYVEAIAGTSARILDTRKTAPGMRALQKYAVTVGGGSNHRSGLDDGVLIKDNHVVAAGGVTEAVRRAQSKATHGLRIEVEVTTLAQLDEALATRAEVVLLDNMTSETVAEAVSRTDGRALLEVSGGVNLETIRSLAVTGVDLISVGELTHSAPAIDMALELE
jgi:nicotinate-nucleotide pyrophosphorylase (carboxylating)